MVTDFSTTITIRAMAGVVLARGFKIRRADTDIAETKLRDRAKRSAKVISLRGKKTQGTTFSGTLSNTLMRREAKRYFRRANLT